MAAINHGNGGTRGTSSVVASVMTSSPARICVPTRLGLVRVNTGQGDLERQLVDVVVQCNNAAARFLADSPTRSPASDNTWDVVTPLATNWS